MPATHTPGVVHSLRLEVRPGAVQAGAGTDAAAKPGAGGDGGRGGGRRARRAGRRRQQRQRRAGWAGGLAGARSKGAAGAVVEGRGLGGQRRLRVNQGCHRRRRRLLLGRRQGRQHRRRGREGAAQGWVAVGGVVRARRCMIGARGVEESRRAVVICRHRRSTGRAACRCTKDVSGQTPTYE